MAKSERKFRELILLICARCEQDKKFGAIKLNKLLFYSDFSAYLTFGKSISGQQYFKLPKGPAPRNFLAVANRMRESGDLAYKDIEYFGHSQKKPIALRQPDVSVFTSQEINLVLQIIQQYWDTSAFAISEGSHFFLGWKAAQDREIIPYSTALVGQRPPTPEEHAYGLQLEPLAIKCLTGSDG